ncbi:hypothetical protein D3C86_1045760 [compost metagenome]
MKWRFRASSIAAIILCLPSPVPAQTPATQADWEIAVQRKLARQLVTPKEARDIDTPLTLRLRLVVLRDGTLETVALATPSGNAAVDQATINMVRRAGRLPAFASDMTNEKRELMLPVRFQPGDDAPPARSATKTRYADPATGFALAVPAPYQIIGNRKTARFDTLVEVGSASGVPPLAGASGYLCAVGFKAAAPGVRRTQAELNAPKAVEARAAAVRHVQAKQDATLERLEEFELRGARGIDYVVAPGSGPGHEGIRQYTALFDTPQGRVTVACATTRDAMPAALAGLRKIRDGVSWAQQ